MGGSAAVAAAVVPIASRRKPMNRRPSASRPYKETDHVKNYYRVNRY
jgi:hypothetical protein